MPHISVAVTKMRMLSFVFDDVLSYLAMRRFFDADNIKAVKNTLVVSCKSFWRFDSSSKCTSCRGTPANFSGVKPKKAKAKFSVSTRND